MRKKSCSRQESELPGGADVNEHSDDYVSPIHLEDSDPNLRPSKQHQGLPYRRGNPADGDELYCTVEHSAERVSRKSANFVL